MFFALLRIPRQQSRDIFRYTYVLWWYLYSTGFNWEALMLISPKLTLRLVYTLSFKWSVYCTYSDTRFVLRKPWYTFTCSTPLPHHLVDLRLPLGHDAPRTHHKSAPTLHQEGTVRVSSYIYSRDFKVVKNWWVGALLSVKCCCFMWDPSSKSHPVLN